VALFIGIFVAFFLEYIDKFRMNRQKEAPQMLNETSRR
jgi:capsular polysaccharide biosynthesis protein